MEMGAGPAFLSGPAYDLAGWPTQAFFAWVGILAGRGPLSFRVKLTLLGRARLQSCRKLADPIQAPQGTRPRVPESRFPVILRQRSRSQRATPNEEPAPNPPRGSPHSPTQSAKRGSQVYFLRIRARSLDANPVFTTRGYMPAVCDDSWRRELHSQCGNQLRSRPTFFLISFFHLR